MPKISIIVPVYKAEAFLEDCIDSILSQTFSDFELFLVDDGSPDNCGAICEEYAARDGRIRVIHQENRGQAAARNHALTLAEGEWVCFVDSDDLIHPQMVQLLYDAAMEAGAGISMCGMLEDTVLPEDFYREPPLMYELLTMDEETLTALYDRDEYPAWVACAKLIRRETVESHLFCEGRVFEDNEAVCHWVWEAKKLVRLPHNLYFYRTNPESTTKSSFSIKKLDYLWALENIIRFYTSVGYLKMRQRFFDRYAQEVAGSCNGVRYGLKRPELLKIIKRDTISFLRQEGLHFRKEQMEPILAAMHPKLICLYWPVEGAVRTLRQGGIAGVVRKVKEKLGRGADE